MVSVRGSDEALSPDYLNEEPPRVSSPSAPSIDSTLGSPPPSYSSLGPGSPPPPYSLPSPTSPSPPPRARSYRRLGTRRNRGHATPRSQASPMTDVQFLSEVDTAYNILIQFIKKLGPDDLHHIPVDSRFISANGDVKHDLTVAHLEMRAGNEAFSFACRCIYGLTDLSGARMPGPPPDSNEFPMLGNDEEMLAILNARGTVVLNPIFYGSSAQLAIVKLSEVALRIWNLWAATNPSDPINFDQRATEYRRYKKMVLVIREDIQTHMMGHIHHCLHLHLDGLSHEMQAQLCESYNTFQERVEVWRFLCAEGIRDELQNDSRDGVGRIAYEEEMRVFKRDVENLMETADISFLIRLPQQYESYVPAHHRSGFMGYLSRISETDYDFRGYRRGEQVNLCFPGLQRDGQGLYIDWRDQPVNIE